MNIYIYIYIYIYTYKYINIYIYIYIHIYISDLPVVLTSLCKIFVHDSSIFSKAINSKKSEMGPNKYLKLISQ